MDLFVTDYTKHDKLASVEFPQPWAQRLQGKILKVKLAERQLILASDLEAGSFCTLRDLLVRTFATDNNIFQGRLGGSGTCVIPHKGPQHMSAETRKMYDDLVECVLVFPARVRSEYPLILFSLPVFPRRRDNAQSTVRNPEDQKPQSSTEHRKPESGTKDVKPSETLTKYFVALICELLVALTHLRLDMLRNPMSPSAKSQSLSAERLQGISCLRDKPLV